MDEYFVRSPPTADFPLPVATTTDGPLAGLDLTGLLHEPPVVPHWFRRLTLVGYVLFAAGALVLASLPVLAIIAVGRFFESLPW